MSSRRRACQACHVLKARCDPSEGDAGICERCWRLDKECVPAPRKLQRDRIAELEAQVEQLTKLLQSHGVSDTPSTTADVKKRKLSDGSPKEAKTESSPTLVPSKDVLDYIDNQVSRAQQRQALDAYQKRIMRVSPYIQNADMDLDKLRKTPLLLLSILAFPNTGVLSSDLQHDMAERAISDFQAKMIAAGERNLELVQSLLISVFWFRARPGFKHATIMQLSHLAVGMAADLGIGGPQASYDPGVAFDRMEGAYSLEARRIWLSCFIASSGMTTILRRPDSNPWTYYHNDSLNAIRTYSSRLEDRLFCQIVHAEEICQRITTRLELADITRFWDLSDPSIEVIFSQLRLAIDDWAAKIPQDLRRPELMFYQQIALIYLNEPVLHTQFNKSTFCPPLLPEKMTPSDFACPTVTVNHVAALYALKDACHEALNIATTLPVTTVLSTSSLCYSPRILYALFMLLKLHIAVTAHSNTYGIILSNTELYTEYYLEKVIALSDALAVTDAGTHKSFVTQILQASTKLAQWFQSYNTKILEKNLEKDANAAQYDAFLATTSGAVDAMALPAEMDLGAAKFFEDEYMLNSLFAEEIVPLPP
ncbi:hypothetical protein AC578_7822 [Pseudocercospora eumusae]|uniref:Zn(2)-C6 fungal-type domain-containing protein n=1 Tax=Pseudocercospora eumusae TaxID=321146 RepID=A0A139HIY7_9PEZI|nr:hypothetical protein AC578_7822 [Pseudocercospora eumusae]